MSSFDKEVVRLASGFLASFFMLEEEELGQLGVLEHQTDSATEFGLANACLAFCC